jgi:hypothetical protein
MSEAYEIMVLLRENIDRDTLGLTQGIHYTPLRVQREALGEKC